MLLGCVFSNLFFAEGARRAGMGLKWGNMPPGVRPLAVVLLLVVVVVVVLLMMPGISLADAAMAPAAAAALDAALGRAVREGVTPGAVGLVGSGRGGWLYARAFGRSTYEDSSEEVSVEESQFDLASLSKVVATTAAVARLYQEGRVGLDDTVASILGDSFAANGKADVTLRHCMLHKAGFPADPQPNYWSEAFGCPQLPDVYGNLSFACSRRIYASLMGQQLDAEPGARYLYSDLSFITLMYVVGSVVLRDGLIETAWMREGCAPTGAAGAPRDPPDADVLQCAFEAYYREVILVRMDAVCSRRRVGRNGDHKASRGASDDADAEDHCGMRHTSYLPSAAMASRALPTSVPRVMPDSGRPLRGVVEDGNAAAMGGIAGHAGVFSRAGDLANYALAWLSPSSEGLLNATTVSLFSAVDDDTGEGASSRALGWNTNDPRAPDYGWDLSCGGLSAETYTHVGYTGTQICIDPRRNVFTVLLTNRVYPVDKADSGIHDLRAAFNSIVAAGVDDGSFGA